MIRVAVAFTAGATFACGAALYCAYRIGQLRFGQ